VHRHNEPGAAELLFDHFAAMCINFLLNKAVTYNDGRSRGANGLCFFALVSVIGAITKLEFAQFFFDHGVN